MTKMVEEMLTMDFLLLSTDIAIFDWKNKKTINPYNLVNYLCLKIKKESNDVF